MLLNLSEWSEQGFEMRLPKQNTKFGKFITRITYKDVAVELTEWIAN